MCGGELASHKRSLTHHPSSQGWAPGVHCYMYIPLFVRAKAGWVTSPFFFSCYIKASVLCTCIFMYIHIQTRLECNHCMMYMIIV